MRIKIGPDYDMKYDDDSVVIFLRLQVNFYSYSYDLVERFSRNLCKDSACCDVDFSISR